MAAEKAKPHVLLFPFPLQGHVPPMLKLAKLLSYNDLHITFLSTESIHDCFVRNSPEVDRLSQSPRFRFRTVPDGAKGEDPRPVVQLLDLVESLRTRCREPYRECLVPKSGEDLLDGWPPVSCVVADGVFPLAFQVPDEMGIPVIILRTSSACSVWAYSSIPELIKRGELPFPEGADMDERIQGVAGMESLLRRRDLPGLLRHAKSSTDRLLQLLITISTNLQRAKALVLNTFESLDAPVLPYICSLCPLTYTIGPLHLLLKNLNSSTDFPSLWQQDRSCMVWLDTQPNKSVVYISFGSITIMSRDELLEFWHGLVNSGQRFLWVTRPDLVQGMTEQASDQTTPSQLEEGIRERGCLVSWAPQEDVLAHPAVGCFLTHSGWNSTLESIVAGVPMICWPFFADQQITSRFVSEVWKIGVDMKDTCDRRTVERMVRKVMMDAELRTSICEMAKIARESAEEGGSSHMNFQKLIQSIKSVPKENRTYFEEFMKQQ